MTLTKLVIGVGITAVFLTIFSAKLYKQNKNLFVSYLQHFTGGLFIFSGLVKAADPLGTAYKMVDYFTEFKYTFEETWMSFIAPVFPWLSSFSVGFAVFMIVLEIVLGVMLIMGSRNRFTSWLFFLVVAFFTFLTGFTALTGYVPDGVNFFDFANWGAFKESNMKVTDCGCFGDFLVLKPFVSFQKDLVLLIPAFIFLFKWRDMHTIFTPKARTVLIAGSLVASLLYCYSNYMWDIPYYDFRPFRKEVNIQKQKALEEESMANAPVSYVFTSKEDGAVTTLSMEEYMKQYKNFPKEQFESEQVMAEPEIPQSKISEFAVEDLNGNDMTDEILNYQGYSLMYVCYTLKYSENDEMVMVPDTSWLVDTVGTVGTDGFQLVKKVDKITQRQVEGTNYSFPSEYKKLFTDKVNPFAVAAQKAGVKVYAIAGKAGGEVIKDFVGEVNATYPMYMADDILLKTIVRSNPGIVLIKDGTIVEKWHYKNLPMFDEVQAEFFK